MSITTISIGDKLPIWIPQPRAGATFNDDVGIFVAGFPRLQPSQIAAFDGAAKFGIMQHRQIAILTLVIGDVLDTSVPYHASLITRDEPPSPVSDAEHRLLFFCLVDSMTAEVANLRAATISPHVSGILYRTVRSQVANPISEEDFIADAQDWNNTYQTARSVRRASSFSKLGA